MNVSPTACNNICPPSPAPPAGGGPTTNVFSVAPNDEVPTVKVFVINTLWFTHQTRCVSTRATRSNYALTS